MVFFVTQVGTFHLRVRRNIDSPDAVPVAPVFAAAPPAMPAPVAAAPAYASIEAEAPYESLDEGMVYVTVPKVRP